MQKIEIYAAMSDVYHFGNVGNFTVRCYPKWCVVGLAFFLQIDIRWNEYIIIPCSFAKVLNVSTVGGDEIFWWVIHTKLFAPLRVS